MKSFGNITPHYWLTGFVHLFSYLSIYYCLSLWQIPLYFDKGKYLRFGLSLIFTSTIIMSLWYLGMTGLVRFVGVSSFPIPKSFGPYLLETVQAFAPGMLLLAIESYQGAQREQEQLALASQKSVENELNLLKAKLNPGFLFNALHNLQTFVDRESEEAPDMILKLSSMLDYILYKSQQEEVGLLEEVEAINNFVELEKLRIGDRLEVQMNTKGSHTITIAPMSLLSLLEHKLEEFIHKAKGDIKLKINISENSGSIFYDSEISKKATGQPKIDINFEDIRRQLNITYPEGHQFEVIRKEHSIQTTLQIGSYE